MNFKSSKILNNCSKGYERLQLLNEETTFVYEQPNQKNEPIGYYKEQEQICLKITQPITDLKPRQDGQVWYNSTTGNLRVQGIGTSSWSSSGNLPVGNTATSMFGTQNAAIMAGGQALSPGPAPTANTLEYGGLSWISLPTLASGARKSLGGCGTTTAGLVFGGFPPTTGNTEEWNGSVWSEQNNLNTPRGELGGAGTQTAGLAIGGDEPPSRNATEEYNGATWSTAGVGTLTTARCSLGGAGTQTAALAFGGAGGSACTEEYNGATWSTVNPLSSARYELGGAGTQTAALAFGGSPVTNATEEYSPSTTLALTKTFDYSGSTGAVILSQVSSSLNFADDTAAATGGIPLGGLYRNGNFIVIRLT